MWSSLNPGPVPLLDEAPERLDAVGGAGVGLVAPGIDAEFAQTLGAGVHAVAGAGDRHVVVVLRELPGELKANAGRTAGHERQWPLGARRAASCVGHAPRPSSRPVGGRRVRISRTRASITGSPCARATEMR